MAVFPQQKPQGFSTICLPIEKALQERIVATSELFRDFLDRSYRENPELFPEAFASGYLLKDDRVSVKLGVRLRRIECKSTDEAFTIRPSFVMPSLTAFTDDVADPLFLRRFGVPFWALTHVFGRSDMYWYRLEISLGRNSIVGTTVRHAEMPKHLLADEHHQRLEGEKIFIATTVAEGCCLGASVIDTADEVALTEAYQTFKSEAVNVEPNGRNRPSAPLTSNDRVGKNREGVDKKGPLVQNRRRFRPPKSPQRPSTMMSQTSAVDKTVSLDSAVSELRSFLLAALHKGLTFHDFEQGVHQRVLQIGHAATGDFLTAQGSGDLGPSLTLPNGDTVRRLEDLHTRELTCLFGTFTLERSVYGTREGQKIEFVPLDSRLALPPGKFSYLLEDFNQLFATENPFAKVATTLERLLCLKQHVDSLERQNRSLGADVEAFRQAQPVPAAAEEKEILVRTADCKGVPMRRAADAPPITNHEHKPGPKKDRKKMAVVGSTYTVDPYVRTPEQIVEALFRDPGSEKPDRDRPKPMHKRVIARMNEYQTEEGEHRDGLVDVFVWLAQQVNARNPLRDKKIVNLMDGEHRLWEMKDLVPAGGLQVDVLDLLHVTPRLWTVAGLFAPTASAKAQKWVRQWLLEVLRGQVDDVMKDMRAKGEKELSKKKQTELEKVCGYLENNKERLKYDVYLKAGYPIASGVIEGACRHYVKDRMERTGMSWIQAGAQPMLELRSTNLNGDWDAFMAFHRDRQTTLFHPHRSLLEQIAWPLAV